MTLAIMPTWFIVMTVIGAGFAVNTIIRALSKDGLEISGQRISRPTIFVTMTIMCIVLIVAAAVALGFFPDHAP